VLGNPLNPLSLPLCLEKTSSTNSALLPFATLVGLSKGEISPPHPYPLPSGERDEIPLQIPLLIPVVLSEIPKIPSNSRCAIWETMTHQLCPATLRYFSRFIKGEKYTPSFEKGRMGWISY